MNSIANNQDLVNFLVKNIIPLIIPMVAITVAEQFLKEACNRLSPILKKPIFPAIVWSWLPIPLGIIYMIATPMQGKTWERIILYGIAYGILNERLYVWVFGPMLDKWKSKNNIQDPADGGPK